MYQAMTMPLRRTNMSRCLAVTSACKSPKITTVRHLSSAFNVRDSRRTFDKNPSLICFSVNANRQFSISVVNFQEAKSSVVTEAVKTQTASVEATTQAAPVTESKEVVLDFLPEIPNPVETLVNAGAQAGIEPSFVSMGLASWWPPGLMQYFMEQLHLGLDMPWWGTIMLTTACIRCITLPFVIMSQKNSINMANHGPKMQDLQQRMTEARQRGDHYASAQIGMELQEFMKKHDISPFKSIGPIFVQLPFFMGMFLGLRGMANLPVLSMCDGGLFWFSDLSLTDPYCILPALTAVSLFFQLKIGADGLSAAGQGKVMKFLMTCMPPFVFFVTWNFPAACQFYWTTTNIISIGQAKILRTPYFREKLGIPVSTVKPPPSFLPSGKPAGFFDGFKESFENVRHQSRVIDRREYDAKKFSEAGQRGAVRTYKFDPTKVVVKNKK